MTILWYCLGAALLMLTGAIVSGGLALPARTRREEPAAPPPADPIESELREMLQYGFAKEDTHAL